ncbi:Hypothetical predicted protein [Pelobates cultripes]|uniref:Uncharacterized protein n=1 Tax=Pelobates cultripes TaxID=61616 RepID=A0AAD1RGC6_PELCU|nr:Hypothetical predicted protein [Pelobates cultripes]
MDIAPVNHPQPCGTAYEVKVVRDADPIARAGMSCGLQALVPEQAWLWRAEKRKHPCNAHRGQEGPQSGSGSAMW